MLVGGGSGPVAGGIEVTTLALPAEAFAKLDRPAPAGQSLATNLAISRSLRSGSVCTT